MKAYIIKFSLLSAAAALSVFFATMVTKYPINSAIYTAILYLLLVFVLVHYITLEKKGDNPNSGIRKIMIGSMLRLVMVVIFLFISLFNQQKKDVGFVLAYIICFLLLLFFDISEMRSKLRLESEKSKNNTNA